MKYEVNVGERDRERQPDNEGFTVVKAKSEK